LMNVSKPLVFALCLVPAAKVGLDAALGHLSANPIAEVMNRFGFWTLSFLVLSLAATPMKTLFGWTFQMRLRRMIGLFAFFYGSLHFLTWFALDKFFDMHEILGDFRKRLFIIAGLVAFVSMLPLAITSTAGWIRRLGGKRWQRLHRLVYLSAIAAVVHYYWLVKSDVRLPLLYGSLVAIELLFRVGAGMRKRSAVKPGLTISA